MERFDKHQDISGVHDSVQGPASVSNNHGLHEPVSLMPRGSLPRNRWKKRGTAKIAVIAEVVAIYGLVFRPHRYVRRRGPLLPTQ